MARKISMQQIADRLGVSKYTVSQALAGKEGVSESTRSQVMAMARALGYRMRSPESEKGQQAKEATGPMESTESTVNAASPANKAVIKVLVGFEERHHVEPSFWGRVKLGLEAGCKNAGIQPVFFNFSHREETDWVVALMKDPSFKEASGLIVAGSCPTSSLLQFNRSGKPIVLVDHEDPLIAADAVLNANVEAGRMACHHLLAQGCHSIAFVGRDTFAVSFRERWWGCKMAIDDRLGRRTSARYGQQIAQDLAGDEDFSGSIQLRKWTVPYMNSSWKQRLSKRVVTEESLPSGFVCANDDIALGLIVALSEAGIAVPEQCRVIGIDNSLHGSEAPIPLTTVNLAKEWLGLRAVESFVRKLQQPGVPDEKIIFSGSLIIRSSG